MTVCLGEVGSTRAIRLRRYMAPVVIIVPPEVNVDPVDVRHELRQGIQLRFRLAPVERS